MSEVTRNDPSHSRGGELDAETWHGARDGRSLCGEQSPCTARDRAGSDETPRDPGQHQGDRDLHDRKQDRVVLSARVGRLDVAAEVEAMRQAAAGELGYERKQ